MAVSGQTEFKQLTTLDAQNDRELLNHNSADEVRSESNEMASEESLKHSSRIDAVQENTAENNLSNCEPELQTTESSKDNAIQAESKDYKKSLRSQTKNLPGMEKENENLNPDKLMKKLGLDSVQHLALQSYSVQEAGLKINGNVVVKGSDGCMNDAECYNDTNAQSFVNKVLEEVKDLTSDAKSDGNSVSRSSTPASYDEFDLLEVSNSNKKIKDQKTLVEKFKAELRTEEAKLVFLRKLLESQLSKKNGQSIKPSLKDGSKVLLPSFHMKQGKNPSGYSTTSTVGQNAHVQIAPKIVLPARTLSSGPNVPKVVPSIVSVASKQPLAPSSSFTVDGSSGGTRQKYAIPHSTVNSQNIAPATTGSHQSLQQKYYIQVGNQLLPASGPPPTNRPVYTLQSYSNSTTTLTSTGATMSSTNVNVSSKQAPVSSQESQASKQSAAKAALRRQLEQTLLQIPPPKPPPADWSAVPNVNSMDFMMLVGLDEIVDDLLASEGKPTMSQVLAEMMPTNPRICAQCNVDFSPSWRPKPESEGESFLCEKCSTMNVKKELKAEHTSRLKAAFLRALKQEQEIEEKIKAGEDVHIGAPAAEKQESVPQATTIHHPQHVHSVHQPYKHHSSSQSVEHHHPVIHHRHHQVVQHYPRHTSLVHQLHQQHMQQQQMEIESSIRRGSGSSSSGSSSGRWHPYIPSHHHSSHVHSASRHGQRSYIPSSEGRHEYYVVHHPQHSNIRWAR